MILAYAVLVWDLSTNLKSARIRWLAAPLVMVLLFQTHSFVAFCCAVSVILFCLLFRPAALPPYLAASALGFVSWFGWSKLLGPSIEGTASLIASDPGLWWNHFLWGLRSALVDLDVVGCFPLLLWAVVLVLMCRRGRSALTRMIREPLVSFILLSLLVQTVAAAAVFGTETASRHSLLRYMPHLAVFALASSLFALNQLVSLRSFYLLACACVVGSNLLTFSYWARLRSRNTRISWLGPVYSEILRPQETALDAVVGRLRGEAAAAPRPQTVMVVLPYWVHAPMIFYLGDSYLVRPMLEPHSPAFDDALLKALGEVAYRQLFARPEWILDLLLTVTTGPEYTRAATIPSYRDRPDEGTRPELTRHTFTGSQVITNVILYRSGGNT